MSKIKCDELGTIDGTKTIKVSDIIDAVNIKSPNGSVWRIRVADDGTITAEKISTSGGKN